MVDFVIRVATVNGSGSASANGLLAKTIFRMGYPVGPKNMFPSNIQGLPTWFEVRVSSQGFTGRRGTADLLLALNGATIESDIGALPPGAYVIYDSTKPLNIKRSDLKVLPLPLGALAREILPEAKQRLLFQNLIYVGALKELIGLDGEVLLLALEEQYPKKLLPTNKEMIAIGSRYAREHFPCPLGFSLKGTTQAEGILVDGNTALALGALWAGASVVGWYPITPSTSVIEAFEKYARKYKKIQPILIQAEDETAALGMVLGAMWMGARAFTATSGPGISLMTEWLGYAYYAEIPAVIFDIQRVGPSTGMPTRTQQSDLLQAAFASHGDTGHILLFPGNPGECFDMGLLAFDLAERYQTPVLVLSDLEIGMNDWVTPEFRLPQGYTPDRGKVLSDEDLKTLKTPFYRYEDRDGDGVPYRTYPGSHPKGASFTRGSGHDRYGRYTEDGAAYQDNMDRIERKFLQAAEKLPKPRVIPGGQAQKRALLYYGSTGEALGEAYALLGESWDRIQIRAYPLGQSFLDELSSYEKILVIEQNRDGQMEKLLKMSGYFRPTQMVGIRLYDGLPLAALELLQKIKDCL